MKMAMKMKTAPVATLSDSSATRVSKIGLGLLLLSSLGLGACKSELHQDPLANQTAAIRNGVPPEKATPPPTAKPVREDALMIDALDFYNLRVGTKSTFTISGRVLMPFDGHDPVLGQDYNLEVENLADFEGATFDAKTGEFNWTPNRMSDDSQYQEARTLTVKIYTINEPVLKKYRNLELFVSRQESSPDILKIGDLSTAPFIREGESRLFTVVVQDPDAKDVDGMRPKLYAIRANDTKDISHLISMVPSDWNDKNPIVDPNDPTKWTFTMRLDLRNQEITHAKDVFNFGLQVVNRYGHTLQKNSIATVITSVRNPLVSWLETTPINVVAGQDNLVNFTVYDPQAEGTVSFFWGNANWRCDMLPGVASCSCLAQDSTNTSQICTLRWKIPADVKVTDVSIEGYILNQSKVAADPAAPLNVPFKRRLKILPAPNPPTPGPVATPAPSPAPTPTPAAPAKTGRP